jgi:hypothetical protein
MDFGDEFLQIGEGQNQFSLVNGKPMINGKEVDLVETMKKINMGLPKCQKCKKKLKNCTCDAPIEESVE